MKKEKLYETRETLIDDFEEKLDHINEEIELEEMLDDLRKTAKMLKASKDVFVEEGFTDSEAMKLLTSIIKMNGGECDDYYA